MNGADLLVKVLQEHGVGSVATLSGNGLNPFFWACHQAGIRLVDTRNEQAASYAADAYARLTGKLGVCAVSSGIAHANAMAGVINAYFDGAPLLLITGESATPPNGRGKFQELDHPALAAPVCKASLRVDSVDTLEYVARETIAQALAGRPGPVHLSVPLHVLNAPVEGSGTPARRSPSAPPVCASGDPALLAETLAWMTTAKRPVLVVGSGVFYAQAGSALTQFLDVSDIPTMVPIWDRSTIPAGTHQFIGVVGAATGGPDLLSDTDLLILVGARIDYRVGYAQSPALSADARVIHVDVNANELALDTRADLSLLGDPASVLCAWGAGWQERGALPHSTWLKEARQRANQFCARWAEVPPSPPITGHHVVDALRPFLGGDTLFLVDGGNIGQWAHMCLCDGYPETWLTCGASGVVGWGIGGAMGARMAYPDRPIILLTGDGAIGFTLADLESAVRQNLPFVVVLADDQAWGIVISGQRQRYGEPGVLASRLSAVRYDQVAAGMGALGIRVERSEDIAAAIQRGLAEDRPTLIHIVTQSGGPSDPN